MRIIQWFSNFRSPYVVNRTKNIQRKVKIKNNENDHRKEKQINKIIMKWIEKYRVALKCKSHTINRYALT